MQNLKTQLEITLDKTAKVENKTIKFHTKQINLQQFKELSDIVDFHEEKIADILFKRSGTGITIIVTVK